MKTLFCGLFAVLTFFHETSVVDTKPMSDLQLKILKISNSGRIELEISNSLERPLRIWRESNSWGAAHWRVLVIRKGKLETFFQNPDEGFTKNNPAYDEIASRGHTEKQLDLNREGWSGPEKKVKF